MSNSEIDSDSEIDDISSDNSYEEVDESDLESIEQQTTFDNMILYLTSIAYLQIQPSNKIKREIELIKSGLSTKKKLADQKRNIKKLYKSNNKIELEQKFKHLNDTYALNKFRLDKLYLQKNTNINNVKINRKEFFKNCPNNLKAKIFITITNLNSNKILEEFIKDEYLADEIEKHLYDVEDEIEENIFDEFEDDEITIKEIFNAMQTNASGPNYMKFVMFINMFEFNRFINYAQNTIAADGKISDIEALIDELPEFLSSSAKENKLHEIFKETEYFNEPRDFTMDHVAKFLMHNQTSGAYYQALIFLADYYKVEHKNCVPMFDNLGTGDIKEEALGIYITLRAYQTDEFIVDNYNFMNYTLQEPQQISWLCYRNSKKTDMTLPLIRTNHEFNEKHHSGKIYKINDAQKKSYAKIHGRHTIYFYFDTKDYKSRKNIKSYLYDSYMEQYVKNCRDNAINAILLNNKPRDKFIFKLLKESLEEQVISIDATLVKYKDTEFENSTEFKYKIENRNLKQTVLNDLNVSQIALDMFACKLLGVISFQNLCSLFILKDQNKDANKISNLKLCLSGLNIIEKIDIDEKNIKLTWKQLNKTIIKFDTGKDDLKNILYEYWLELNESYENIIHRIQTFYENLVCNETDKNQIEQLIKNQMDKYIT